jgi:VWFA-related protein
MLGRGDDVTRPRSIVLVIDYSASQLSYITTSIDAAKTLVDKLGPLDKMAIVTDDVSLLVAFTRDKAKLKQKLESLKTNANSGDFGRSSQFSALFATLRELVSNEERTLIIFQTDGDELNSLQPPFASVFTRTRQPRDFGLVDILTAEQKAHATVYSIIPGNRLIGLSPEEQSMRAQKMIKQRIASLAAIDRRTAASMEASISGRAEKVFAIQYAVELNLQHSAVVEVALKSGRWAEYLEEPSQAADIYARILSDINNRYVIGYYPTNKERDGKLRRVHISVRDHPEYAVVGRQSYYAPEGNN